MAPPVKRGKNVRHLLTVPDPLWGRIERLRKETASFHGARLSMSKVSLVLLAEAVRRRERALKLRGEAS